jgi:hypothetical protein
MTRPAKEMVTPPNRHPRDFGGSFSLHNPDDGSPIREAIVLGARMLLITDKCTYAIQVADQIDPDRTNPALPHNIQQKLFDRGAESEVLCRSFLQAWRMFRKEFQTVDIAQALQRSFEVLGELIAMQDVAEAFKSAERLAIDKAQSVQRKDGSFAIPAVGNVRVHCKTFAQKADHCAVALMAIVRQFYPGMKKQNWDDFRTLVTERYGMDDPFSKLLEAAAPFLQLIRNTRDCLDHGNLSGVTTRDFELHADGQIGVPSIEVNFRGSVVDRCSIASFMQGMAQETLDAFEMFIVHMCAKNMQPFAGMPMTIAPLPETYRKAWRVRFAYGTYYADGQFAPCG